MRQRQFIRAEVRDCMTCGETTPHELYRSWEIVGRWMPRRRDVHVTARCTVCLYHFAEAPPVTHPRGDATASPDHPQGDGAP